MTAQEWKGILPDVDAPLLADAALEWLLKNTKLSFDPSDPGAVKALPAGARLFVLRFCELMGDAGGVVSESINGMSQSFSSNKTSLLWALAKELLGIGVLKPQVAFGKRCKRWVSR